MALKLAQSLTEMNTRKSLWGVESGRRLKMTTSQPSVSRLSRQCGILNILQPCRPPRPIMGIALLNYCDRNNRIICDTEYLVRVNA
jgi:hypothetical protein